MDRKEFPSFVSPNLSALFSLRSLQLGSWILAFARCAVDTDPDDKPVNYVKSTLNITFDKKFCTFHIACCPVKGLTAQFFKNKLRILSLYQQERSVVSQCRLSAKHVPSCSRLGGLLWWGPARVESRCDHRGSHSMTQRVRRLHRAQTETGFHTS